ncbi:ATP-binding cassette domain-containing protein [Granulicella arctica]|uniref:Molybdate transport system ATP-binding protein n=1 Tax=Granulicella arctica TaxID=940613 RepID=A0A7Y9TLB8_9BACT|nr:ATP-binding cassette domain-containing protein [Granulicella arctica]NYF79962.1 molybdate transport system ATP-binding protein [Granulicella arctica]
MQIELKHHQGPLTLDAIFTLTQPWTVLFGPSGSGKTTILRAIQGFVRPDHGKLTLASTPILNTATRLFVPPYQRPVRSAGQSPRLFPNMTVAENIRYGVPIATLASTPALLDEILHLFRLEPLATKQPQALSGGEKQRVSVARATASAVATPNALLLLDEPFTGLDYTLRDTLATDLQSWLAQRRTPVLSVTHDIGEAFLLQAEVLRLEAGRITHQGPTNQVLAPERTRLLTRLHS